MDLVDRLQANFNILNSETVDILEDIYSRDMIFQDPAHHIIGIDNFKLYCKSLYENVDRCQFSFTHITKLSNMAFLEWNMYLTHPKLNKGNEVIVPGISKIEFNEMITLHRDYFDLGNMLYEQLPCIGKIIKNIKNKLGQ